MPAETAAPSARRFSSFAGGRREIAAPDVAAVDDTADQGLAGKTRGRGRNRAPGEVDGERLDGGGGEHGPGLRGELRVRGGDQDRGAVGCDAEVGVRALRRGREVGCRDRQALAHQGGLVELHPLRAGGAEGGEQFGVHGQQVIQAAERAETGGRGIRRLRQGEQRDGTDDDRTGRVAVGARLGHLTGEAVARQGERRLGPDLGDEVVVVRVEPLGHLERACFARAARGGEQRAEADRAVRRAQVREPLRQDARGHRGVEHLVVVRERLGNRRVLPAETEFDEARARRAAKSCRRRLQLGFVDGAGPERLDSALELAAAADPGIAQDRAGRKGWAGFGHEVASRSSGRVVRMPPSRSTARTAS